MDPTITVAVVGAIATLLAAIITARASRRKRRGDEQKKPLAQKPDYEILSDAYRLGSGVAALVFASAQNQEEFKASLSSDRDVILRLSAKIVPQKRFPSVHSLMRQTFATGDLQTANTLHQEITGAIFDCQPPAVQVAFVFGAYIPILSTYDPSSEKGFPLSMALGALEPMRGTVYKSSDALPKKLIGWYEDILAEHDIPSAAHKIAGWFNSLR